MKSKKNEKADLQGKRFLFFEIGMILSLTAVLAAFNWATDKKNTVGFIGTANFDYESELIPVRTYQEPKHVEPPKKHVSVIDIIDNSGIVDIDDPNIWDDAPTDVPINIIAIATEETIDEPDFFYTAEQMPEFPGGIKALLKFLASNINYPEMAKLNGIQGKVFVSFIVNKKGEVEKISIPRSIDPLLDREALRVVGLMPKWTPGLQCQKPVNVAFTVPINFTLK